MQDQERWRNIASLMVDEYAQRIIVATSKRLCSAAYLSQSFGIPLAASYRRIRALEKAGLLECRERHLNRKGKRVSLYASRIKEMTIAFRDGTMSVRCRLIESGTPGDQRWLDHEVVLDTSPTGADHFEE